MRRRAKRREASEYVAVAASEYVAVAVSSSSYSAVLTGIKA
jgi:hypothetical protein